LELSLGPQELARFIRQGNLMDLDQAVAFALAGKQTNPA
jgi:hypothetical protein